MTWPNTLIRFAIDRLLSHLQAVLFVAALPSRQVRYDQRCNGCTSQIPGGQILTTGPLPLQSERFSPPTIAVLHIGPVITLNVTQANGLQYGFQHNRFDEILLTGTSNRASSGLCPPPMHPLRLQRRRRLRRVVQQYLVEQLHPPTSNTPTGCVHLRQR